MTPHPLTRRATLVGALSLLSGCAAVSALSGGGRALDTYDLTPSSTPAQGKRSARTLVVARPEAPAAIVSDRILVKPDPRSVTYLPGARWSAEAPLLVQSLLVRSISATGRMGYVGQVENGPAAEQVLLARLDAFQVDADPSRNLVARVDLALSLLSDADQTLIASRSFAGSARAEGDSAAAIVAAFQTVMNQILPEAANWVADT
ncbi:ABC-type transport auxiliary lipoprotein family protein [Paracoccus endophyticus]|uniref:ABC-type transport auxiliary lipoprotein family protein n=1 Tax=Paracoccus endophyticus TaxID=2233774 RepID=UPI000DDB6F81|nr:ABC-type transport auxiliary lipoprotein family protein [Paracoccus endophyticus]